MGRRQEEKGKLPGGFWRYIVAKKKVVSETNEGCNTGDRKRKGSSQEVFGVTSSPKKKWQARQTKGVTQATGREGEAPRRFLALHRRQKKMASEANEGCNTGDRKRR